MIFVNHFGSSQSAIDYHGHLSRGDYFGHEVDAPRIEGKLAERLGLEGRFADKETYTALCKNEHPETGEKLTQRTREDRRSLTDFTFDVPKAVSLVSIVDSRVNDAVNDAVRETMQEIEQAAAVRVRKDGQNEDRTTGNLMWIMWSHETGRPLDDSTVDPQKHRHVTIINASYDSQENEIKAVQLGDIVRDKGYYQSAYHARLGAKLSALGYGVEKDGNSFKLSGIDKDFTDRFSRRTAVIEKEAQKREITDAKEKGKLGRQTRNKKGDELGSEELRQEWLKRMTPEEKQSLTDARHQWQNVQKQTAREAVHYAIEHSFERVSTIPEKKLKAEALKHAVGSVTPDDVSREMAARKDLIREERDKQMMVTSRATLQAETSMLDFVRDGRGRYGPLLKGGQEQFPEYLTAEQGGAVSIFANSRNAVTGFIGDAGTGKTTAIESFVKAYESPANGNKTAFGAAPSASGAHGLKGAGIENAFTLERVLVDKPLQAKMRGQLLIVDEAGMISTKDMNRLFKVTKENKTRLILAGDYKQHGSVQAGDAFRLLEKEGGLQVARLKDIRRQRPADYKKAVESIAKGTRAGLQKGFDLLDEMGNIKQVFGRARREALVGGYLKDVAEKKSTLIVTPTHAEADSITDELRETLKATGKLGKREKTYKVRKATNWTEAQKGDARNYEKGMVVEFYQNVAGSDETKAFTRGEAAVVTKAEKNRVTLLRQDGTSATIPSEASRFQVFRVEELKVAKGDRIRIKQNGKLQTQAGNSRRVSNGDISTVKDFAEDGSMQLSDGTILPATWGHFTHGYVDTSYASQGKTVDRVHIAAGSSSVLAVNAQQWYVSTSRAREKATVYLDDKKEMRDAITRTGERLSATELVKGTSNELRRTRMQEVFERNRVIRYWKDRQPKEQRGNWRDR